MSETTNGRTVSYQYDASGNETSLAYPSGAEVTREFDALARPELVRSGGSPAVRYGYQGPDLVAQKDLGNGLAGQMSYDAARRRVETSYQQPGAPAPVVGESVSRTPRGQISSVARSDEGGSGFVARYDGAGRLKEQGRDPGSFPGNNTLPDPLALAGLPDSSVFAFDVADNLLAKSEETSRVVETVPLPPDGSHRNRPGSVGEATALEWDANGNLARKGDLTFRYDFRNRLTEVSSSAGPVASYRYDAFNRRVEKRVGETREETVWSGWQSLETYRDGALASRRTYGLGFDEVVKLEQDRDGDGTLDEAQVPLYDTSGNLVALTRGTDGAPVEKYTYSPFGEQRIFVDLTKPRIEQLRREGDRLLLEVSERIQLAALVVAQASGELTLTHPGTDQAIEVEVTLPVLAGRTGAKRIAIRPTSAVEEGAPLRLHLAPGAILDRFQNPLAGAYDRDLAWSALGAEVIEDTAPPQLDLVVVHENVLTVGFTEAIAAEQATAEITVDGNPVTWTSDEGGYTLHTEPLASGVHRIGIEATLADLAGTPLGEGFTRTVELTPTGALLYARPDPREVSSSAASNPCGFQGLPKDSETGFVYARNRYYDPEMGRFVSADPLGYVDGGNLYQYGLNDPVNNADPLGLESGATFKAIDERERGRIPRSIATLDAESVAKEAAATLAEELSWIGIGNGLSGLLAGYDFVRQEEVRGFGPRALAGLSAIPGVPSAVRKLDKVLPAARAAARLDLPGGTGDVVEKIVHESASTPIVPITNPSRLLPPPARANPYLEGAPLFAGPAPKGLEIEMVMAPGQSRPGGFGTTDIVSSVDYARNDLAITPDYKPEIGSVQRWSVPEGTQVQWGPVGPQQSNGVTYPGGGTQVEVLNYDERLRLKEVGPRLPLKQD